MSLFTPNRLNKQPEEVRKAVAKTLWNLPYGAKIERIRVDLESKKITYYGSAFKSPCTHEF